MTDSRPRDLENPPADDWDSHWDSFGSVARENPANVLREQLIFERLGAIAPGDRFLDIGCGQGQFAMLVAGRYPELSVRGLEYSALGVERARKRAGERGLSATFHQRDLLVESEVPTDERGWANLAVCSEVLEHVDEPAQLLRQALDYLGPGCRLVVTVPGGPRTAFDRYIGHRRHFDHDRLKALLEGVGLEAVEVDRAGFPFFNLYRLTVMARGKALIRDLSAPSASSPPEPSLLSRVQAGVMRAFDFLFRFRLKDNPLGWQLVATAVVPHRH